MNYFCSKYNFIFDSDKYFWFVFLWNVKIFSILNFVVFSFIVIKFVVGIVQLKRVTRNCWTSYWVNLIKLNITWCEIKFGFFLTRFLKQNKNHNMGYRHNFFEEYVSFEHISTFVGFDRTSFFCQKLTKLRFI